MAAALRPTFRASRARHYLRPGGPWRVPTLDHLLAHPGVGLVDGTTRLDAGGLEAITARVAGGLAALGVRRGRAVSWQLPNGIVPVVLYRACWRLGAVAAPVLHNLGPADAERALGQVDPALVLDLPRESAGDPEALLRLVDGPPVPRGAVHVAPSDLAVVLFTSGSTGTPKAVLHSHRGLSWKATLMAGVHGLGTDDAVLMPAPLAHVSGLLNGVLVPGAAGMRTVLMARFDPEEALARLSAESVTFMAGPPTFFVAMASAMGDRPAGSVRLISTGGASVTPAFVEDAARAFGARVKRTYGSTEAPTVTTSRDDDPFEQARDTDGRAVGEVELRVVDPASGRSLGPGQPGELWVRGPELFCGYGTATQNEAVLHRGGWFGTGDLATVDAERWLRIVGRLKDVIIRGGENIASAEVEGILESHPDVVQAVVVGYPDELMGERVAAFVVSRRPFDLETCGRWFSERGAARFKTPERVVHLEALPLLGSGKADRAALQKLAAGS